MNPHGQAAARSDDARLGWIAAERAGRRGLRLDTEEIPSRGSVDMQETTIRRAECDGAIGPTQRCDAIPTCKAMIERDGAHRSRWIEIPGRRSLSLSCR